MGLFKTFLAGRTVAAPADADEFSRLDAVTGNTESSTWAQMKAAIGGGGDLLAANNLSDVASAPTSLGNLGGAPLASPTFTGTPAAPTAATATNTTQVATTAYVRANRTEMEAAAASQYVASDDVRTIVELTQAAYDALTPDADTLYVIVG